MYLVKLWGKEHRTHSTFNTLKEAKKVAKGLGHTAEIHNNIYEPVAYVAIIEHDEYYGDMEACVYNPVFKVK